MTVINPFALSTLHSVRLTNKGYSFVTTLFILSGFLDGNFQICRIHIQRSHRKSLANRL